MHLNNSNIFNLTVFTPTYNRGYLLKRLYNSLLYQTYKNFEWIIIDDGSVDCTKQLVNNFIQENKLDIIYIYQHNSGKHVAINNAAQIARGELFFIVDSDDYLTKDSLEYVIKLWKEIDVKVKYLGVSGSIGYNKEDLVGDNISAKYLDCTPLELRYKYNIRGDKAEVIRTDLIRKYPYPVFKEENFLTEAVWWNFMSELNYKIRYSNKINYICNYLNDGLTKNYEYNAIKNWRGTTLYYSDFMKYNIPIKLKLRKLKEYIMLSIKGNKSLKLFYKYLNKNNINNTLKRDIIDSINNNKAYKYYKLPKLIKNKFNLEKYLICKLKKFQYKNIAIYGGGEHTEKLLKYIPSNINIKFILDGDKYKSGKHIEKYEIYSFSDKLLKNINVIIISSESFEDDIYSKLIYKCVENNIELYRLYEENKNEDYLIYGSLYNI